MWETETNWVERYERIKRESIACLLKFKWEKQVESDGFYS